MSISIRVCTKSSPICAMCQFWNGETGSTQITPTPGSAIYQFEHMEVQPCTKLKVEKKSWQTCPNWQQRY